MNWYPMYLGFLLFGVGITTITIGSMLLAFAFKILLAFVFE